MRRGEARWAEVRVGLFVAMVLALIFAGVIYIGIAGSPLEEFQIIHVRAAGGASGFTRGSPVEMGGVNVGAVISVHAPSVRERATILDLKVADYAFRELGAESRAMLLARSLVGQRYLQIEPRPEGTPPLEPGGTIDAVPVADLEALARTANETMAAVRRLSASLESSGDALSEVIAGVKDGALGKLLRDPKLAGNLEVAVTRMAEVGERLASGKGTLGRLIRDPTAARKLETMVDDLSVVARQLKQGDGALGALLTDPELAARIRRSAAGLEKLLEDIRRNPERYVKVKVF